MEREKSLVLRLKRDSGGERFALQIPHSPRNIGQSVSIGGHTFLRRGLEREAIQQGKNCMVAYHNGHPSMVKRYLEEIYNIILTDEAHQVVKIANKDGLHSKVFAVSNGPTKHVKGDDNNWSLSEVPLASDAIPAEVRAGVNWLMSKGIVFDGFMVATPPAPPPQRQPMAPKSYGHWRDVLFYNETPRRLPHRDPVLLACNVGKNGYRVLVELGRWA